jgi:hypothetical protein
MAARHVALTIRFRRRGFQWPVAPHDSLRIYEAGTGELLAELPGSYLYDLIANHLLGLALRDQLATYRQPLPAEVQIAPILAPAPRLRGTKGRRLRGR